MNQFFLILTLNVFPKIPNTTGPVSSDSDLGEREDRWKNLFIGASRGSAEDYESFLKQISQYLSVFLKRYLFSETQIEDCIQECLLAIHRSKQTFDPTKPFSPWFFTIVKHKAIDQIRKNQRIKNREVLEPSFGEYVNQSSPELEIEQATLSLVSKIDLVNREAFTLTKLEGKSIKEASEILNINESAVKVRVHRASKIFKKLVQEEFSQRYC